MTNIISRCIICGQFFDSKKELREHKDKNHRITNSKMMMIVQEITKPLLPKGTINEKMAES
jgi:ABC-type dipeptide/oligopeptide/nickel transport system ATPase component